MECAPPTAGPEEPVLLNPATFERNLAALRQVAPALAELVPAAKPPEGFEVVAARTRDGRTSLRLVQQDGSHRWLGRTSIPGVRAAAMIEQFQAGMGNVLFAGIGEGSEVSLLLQRLPGHRAVFVWEEELLAIQLALRLHEWSSALREERLILLVCRREELAASLSAWLAAHPGHLCPERIMIWPWQSLAEAGELRAHVEAAFQQTHMARQQALAELRQARWPKGTGSEPPDCPARLAILAVHASGETWALAEALRDGAVALGWQAIVSTMRGPADVHPLSRAVKLTSDPAWPPSAAVLLDITRQELVDVLPPDVPAICWLSTNASLESLPARASCDPVAFTSQWLLERAVAGGLNPQQATVCAPAWVGSAEQGGATGQRDLDVVICGDLHATDPGSYGHRLSSHVQIWNTFLQAATAAAERLGPEDLPRLLGSAERQTGVRIEDPQLRQAVLDAFLLRVAPTVVLRGLAQALESAGVRVECRGRGWGDPQAGAPAGQVSLSRAKIVIHVDLAGVVTARALRIAGGGAVLLARRFAHHKGPGGLATLLEDGREMLTFTSLRDLLTQIRRLLADDRLRQAIAEAARARCRAEHGPAARLQQLRTALSSCPAVS